MILETSILVLYMKNKLQSSITHWKGVLVKINEIMAFGVIL